MPSSRENKSDFSNCAFRTLVPNLPNGIQRMLNRALNSFGTDLNVLPRWSEPVPTPNGTKLEREFFPHTNSDICCADGVGFCLYQSGVVDLGMEKDYFKSEIPNAIHWAHYYTPTPKNAEVCYRCEDIPNTTDPHKIDFRDWLPGDYFVYFDATGDKGADHVNIYLGPFVETTADGEDVEEREGPYHMFNSSIGTTGGNAFCTPSTFARQLNYCRKVNRRLWRCRVYAIERLFQNMIGPPVLVKEPKEKLKPDAPPRAEVFWTWSERADAPYPVGRSLTWHDGIHLLKEEGLENDAVQPFASGEIALVRFGKPAAGGDTSLVLVRHRFLASQMRLLDPPPPPSQKDRDDKEADKAKPFYSLYMNLAPLSAYLAKDTEIFTGIPALQEPASKPKPAPKPKTESQDQNTPAKEPPKDPPLIVPAWLRRLWLKPKPLLMKTVTDTAQVTLIALTRGSSDGPPKLSPLGRPEDLTTRRPYLLKDLVSEPVEGTHYWMLPAEPTNAEVWDQKVAPVTVPKGRALVFYNPHSEVRAAFTTSFKLPGDTPLAHGDASGQYALQVITDENGAPITGTSGTLYRIATFAPHEPEEELDQTDPRPGFRIGDFLAVEGDKGQYDHIHETGTLLFHEKVKKFKLFADTTGKEALRQFVMDFEVDLAKLPAEQRKFIVSDRPAEPTGLPKHKADNIWVKLELGVWLTDKERDQVQRRLNDKATLDGIKQRLEQKRSCLVGVKIGRKAGWEIRDGFLSPTEQKPEGNRLTLYRQIKGAGKTRNFPEPPEGNEEARQEMLNWVLTVDLPSDLAILPVLTPSGKAQSAVFELMLGATEEGTNQEDLDAVDQANRKKEPLVRKLLDGELVDLSRESDPEGPGWPVAREPIGRLGDVPAPVSEKGFVKGVHFEILSGENLIDPDVVGDEKNIVPVPKSSWLVLRDPSTSGFFSPDFVNKLVAKLKEYPAEQLLDLAAIRRAFETDGVVKPGEWLDFCRAGDNHRVLSRLITVHVPEWKVDWGTEIKAQGARGPRLPEDQANNLAQDLKEHRWWEGVSLPGLPGDALFFYHPLRFIEWVNTGLDIFIGGIGASGTKPKVKIKPLDRGEDPIDLSPDDRDPFLFRFRTMVGEAATEMKAELTLENVNTATKTFRCTIRRGEIHSLRLVQPTVTVDTQNEQAWMEYAIPVAQNPVETNPGSVHLLADGNEHLQDCGYSKSSFVFIVNYNVRLPDQVNFKLSGDGFKLSVDKKSSLTGARWEANFKVSSDQAGGTVAPETGESAPPAKPSSKPPEAVPSKPEVMVVRGAKSYSIVVDVVGATTKFGASAKLEATFEGGDLPAQITKTAVIATREIAPTPKPKGKGADFPKGEDVAKLQLYLSQISEQNHLPCYRDLGQNKEYGVLPLQKANIDGIYGKSLARAIWRFIYWYGMESAFAAWPIQIRDMSGKPNGEVHSKDLDARVEVPLRDPAAERMGRNDKNYDQYPVVNEKLLKEIVRRFKPPFILPWIDLVAEDTAVPLSGQAPADVVISPDWNKTVKTKSMILPAANDAIRLQAKWERVKTDTVGNQPLPLKLVLPDASAYRFSTGSGPVTALTSSLRELLTGPRLVLLFSGNLSTKEADNILKVSTDDGRVVAAEKLPGGRDLTQAQSDSCRDAALVQFWLSRIPDPDARAKVKSIYKNVHSKSKHYLIDGKWNRACVQSLEGFKKTYAPGANDWKSLATALYAEFQKQAP